MILTHASRGKAGVVACCTNLLFWKTRRADVLHLELAHHYTIDTIPTSDTYNTNWVSLCASPASITAKTST